MYMPKIPHIRATKTGTQMRAADTLSVLLRMVMLMTTRKTAARMPPVSGEITQLATIWPMVGQTMASKPSAAMPAPTTPPTIEWVVETGAPMMVARLTHSADDSSADIMTMMKAFVVSVASRTIRLREMVDTTSPPASRAPEASHIAAISRAPPMVRAWAPTAGPMLLATSLAPILSAI